MFPEVLEALIDRVPDHTPAAVDGWRAAALDGRVYPALVPGTGRRAAGLLLTGVTDGEWTVLDAYEDDLYDLRRLPLTDGGHAWTYASPQGKGALSRDWSADGFARRNLPDYVAACRNWAMAYRAAAGDDGANAGR
jgi:hypothetical protein